MENISNRPQVNIKDQVSILKNPLILNPSRFANQLSQIAQADPIKSSTNLLLNYTRKQISNNDLWEGYTIVIHSLLKNESCDELSLIRLGRMVSSLLNDRKCTPRFSATAKGSQLNAIITHVELLLYSNQPQLAKILLSTLIERGVFALSDNDVATLWVRVETACMDSAEAGLKSFTEGKDLRIDWGNVTRAFLISFCRQLANTLERNDKLDSKMTNIMIEFLATRCCSVSYRETFAASVRANLKTLGDEKISKQFPAIANTVGLPSLASKIENQARIYLDHGKLGSAIRLFIQALDLDPIPFTPETLPSLVYELYSEAQRSQTKFNLKFICNTLKGPHGATLITNVTHWLVEQKRLSEVQSWLESLTRENIAIPHEAKTAFADALIAYTWDKINDNKAGKPLLEAIGHGILTYEEIVKLAPELILELAREARESDIHWLRSANFGAFTSQRNALIKKIAQPLIAEGEYVAVQEALNQCEESKDTIAKLWGGLVIDAIQHANRSHEAFVQVLNACPMQIDIPDAVVNNALKRAVEHGNLEICALILDRISSAYRILCGGELLNKDAVDQWIELLQYLIANRSRVLRVMVKQAPHEMAGGIFTSFEHCSDKQFTFFKELIQAAAALTKRDDYDTFMDLLTLKQRLEPLFASSGDLNEKFDSDIVLGNYLVTADHMEPFLAGVKIAADTILKWGEISNHTKNALQQLIQSINEHLDNHELTQQQNRILARLWPGINECKLDFPLWVSFASKVFPKSRSFLEELLIGFKSFLTEHESKEMSSENKTAMYDALQLFSGYANDDNLILAKFLTDCSVRLKRHLTDFQLMQIWDTYFMNTLNFDLHASDLKQVMSYFIDQLPGLAREISPQNGESFPSVIKFGLRTLWQQADLRPREEFLSVQSDFFNSLPESFYSSKSRNRNMDYSLHLEYVAQLFSVCLNKASPDDLQVRTPLGINTACRAASTILSNLIKAIPFQQTTSREKLRDLILQYIELRASMPPDNLKEPTWEEIMATSLLLLQPKRPSCRFSKYSNKAMETSKSRWPSWDSSR